MRIREKATGILAGVAILLLIAGPSAHAYIDPGAGSFIFQVLIAGLVGATFLIKVFWRQIKGFVRKNVLRRESSEFKDNE